MRYTQDSGVRRKSGSEEYRVVVSVYLTPSERDLWGAGRVRLGLLTQGNCLLPGDGEHRRIAATPLVDGTLVADCSCGGTYSVPLGGNEHAKLERAHAKHVAQP